MPRVSADPEACTGTCAGSSSSCSSVCTQGAAASHPKCGAGAPPAHPRTCCPPETAAPMPLPCPPCAPCLLPMHPAAQSICTPVIADLQPLTPTPQLGFDRSGRSSLDYSRSHNPPIEFIPLHYHVRAAAPVPRAPVQGAGLDRQLPEPARGRGSQVTAAAWCQGLCAARLRANAQAT